VAAMSSSAQMVMSSAASLVQAAKADATAVRVCLAPFSIVSLPRGGHFSPPEGILTERPGRGRQPHPPSTRRSGQRYAGGASHCGRHSRLLPPNYRRLCHGATVQAAA
jgi:hypothetical protein